MIQLGLILFGIGFLLSLDSTTWSEDSILWRIAQVLLLSGSAITVIGLAVALFHHVRESVLWLP